MTDETSRRFSSLIDERLKTEHSVTKHSDTTYPKLPDISKVEVPRRVEIKIPVVVQPKEKSPEHEPEIKVSVLEAEAKSPVRKPKGKSLSDMVAAKVSKGQQALSSQDDIPGN